jgi:nucleoside-diphosphate-sugar epimerase
VGQLRQALQQQRPVQVAGPTVARDWTYMVDAATAVQALLQTPTLTHDIYNVSCGVAVRWQTVVEAFVAHGLVATWTADVAAANIAMHPHQARSPMDITRLQQDTPFRPRYDIAAGVAAYIAQETSLA